MYDKIKKYYDAGIYTKNHIINILKAGGITAKEYESITGEVYEGDLTIEPTEIELLQEETKILNVKVQALTESNQFLEDCIVELAEIVYA